MNILPAGGAGHWPLCGQHLYICLVLSTHYISKEQDSGGAVFSDPLLKGKPAYTKTGVFYTLYERPPLGFDTIMLWIFLKDC